jgi:hypothetical protein
VVSAEDKPEFPLGSSFEGIVWRGNVGTPYANQTYVSIRGSKEITDFVGADLNLVVSGTPRSQLVDMVNWWLRITTPTTNKARQIENTHDALTGAEGFRLYTSTLNGKGLVGSGVRLSIDGHSLGGQLATAFARIFGKAWPVDDLVTFNSPGFLSGSDAVLVELQTLLGTGLSNYAQGVHTNLYASNGINFSANNWWFAQQGTRVNLYQEEGTGTANHYIYKLTDYLALGAALETLSPSLTVATLNNIIQAGSNDMKASYEGVLDAMRQLVSATRITATLVSDAATNEPMYAAAA